MVIGPTQQRVLMQIAEVVSGDYQAVKALATGMLPNFMGFTWVVSTMLTKGTNAGSDPTTNCLSFTPRGIGLHVARDLNAKVAERPDMSFSWQFYAEWTMGAVRVEDEHVQVLTIKDTVT
jgi:hypothetical protein